MSEKKSFTDEQARKILERAANRQEEAERAGLGPGELSLTELKEIASEAGIDPAYVQAAASELVIREDHSPATGGMGIPDDLREVRVVPGTLTDKKWEQMVQVLRAAFGMPGVASEFGDTREWISNPSQQEGAPVIVRASPHDDGVSIDFHQATRAVRQVTYIVGGVFTSMAIMFSVMAGIFGVNPKLWVVASIFAFFGISVFGGGRILGAQWVKSQLEKFDTTADKLELIARTED